MNAKSFLQSVLRVRHKLMVDGKSQKNVMMVSECYRKVSAWYNAWKPSDEQCKRYIQQHRDDISVLMPGGKQAVAWNKKLNSILS